jgi:hypothetical protein
VAARYTKYNRVNTAIAATTQMPIFDMKHSACVCGTANKFK